MKYIIFLAVFLFFSSCAHAEVYYALNVHYESGVLSLNSLSVVYSRISLLNPEQSSDTRNYTVILSDADEVILFEEAIGVLDFIFIENITGDDTTDHSVYLTQPSFDFVVYVPYSKSVSKITFASVDNPVLSIDNNPLFVSSHVPIADEPDDTSRTESSSFIFSLYFFLGILLVVIFSVVIYFSVLRRNR